MRRKRRAMGGKCIAGKSWKLRQEKQSFTDRLQGFPGALSFSPWNVDLEWLHTHSEHADDAAATPVRKLGRIFRHTEQGDPQRFAAEVPQSGACAKDRNGSGERRHTFDRRNPPAVSGGPRTIANEI